MKEYIIRNRETGEPWNLEHNQLLIGVVRGTPAVVTSYYYSKPHYIDLDIWEVVEVEPETI